MIIVLAQISIRLNYRENLEKILETIRGNQFDIMVFPELALTSYNLKEATTLTNQEILYALKIIQKSLKKSQLIVLGTVFHKKSFIYNSSTIISRKDIKYYFKNTLTEHDSKYFNVGKNNLTFEYKKYKVGVLICRDQDNIKLIQKYKKDKCDILLHQSAHYYSKKKAFKKLRKNVAMPIVRAIDSSTLFCKVNCTGKFRKKVSLGNSIIVNKNGYILRQANQFDEELIKFKVKDKK